MGVEVVITQKTIVTLLNVPKFGRFVLNTKENSHEVEAIKICFFKRSGNLCSYDFGKVKNMQKDFKILFKILISCLILKESSIDQISCDHKHFIFYLKNKDEINLSAYIFNHLCEAISESIKHHKKNVPYARLLSELFYQGPLIDALKNLPDNEDL